LGFGVKSNPTNQSSHENRLGKSLMEGMTSEKQKSGQGWLLLRKLVSAEITVGNASTIHRSAEAASLQTTWTATLSDVVQTGELSIAGSALHFHAKS